MSSKKVVHFRKPDCLISRITPATIEYGFKNSVFRIEFSVVKLTSTEDVLKHPKVQQLVEGVMDQLIEQPSRGFAVGLGMFGEHAVLVLMDSETLRIARWKCWTTVGLQQLGALYSTFLCTSPYMLGLCPLFFDSLMVTSTTDYDPTIFDPDSSPCSLEPDSISYASTQPFHRRPAINRVMNKSPAVMEARVIKVAQQAQYGQEASALEAIQQFVDPVQALSLPKLLSSYTFERLLYQVNEETIQAFQLEATDNPIIRRHLEVTVTSTPSRGDLFDRSSTTAQDLFLLFDSLIKTVKSLWPRVIHRDISSNNVLKMASGGFCLIDFDCAKIVDPDEVGKGQVIKAVRTGTQDTMSIMLLRASQLTVLTPEKYTLNQEFESIAYLFWKVLTKKLHLAFSTGNLAGSNSYGCQQKWLDEFAIDSSEDVERRREVFWSRNVRGTSIMIGLVKFRARQEDSPLLRFLSAASSTIDSTIEKSSVKALLQLIVDSYKVLRDEWKNIYDILGWDTYREDLIVIAARSQMWTYDPSQLFSRIRFILSCFGGLADAGLLEFLESLREWGESISIGGYDKRKEKGTEQDLELSFEKLQKVVAGMKAGGFLESVWKLEVSRDL